MRTTWLIAATVVVGSVGSLIACRNDGAASDELLDTGLARVPPIAVRRVAQGRDARPRYGDVVQVHVRHSLPDGKTVTDTRAEGAPQTFKMGRRQAIVGLEQVVATMRLGERCEAHIPWQAAFGSGGGDGVPPRTDLVSEVELIQIQSH